MGDGSYPNLPFAPIEEAVIQVRFDSPINPKVEDRKEIHDKFKIYGIKALEDITKIGANFENKNNNFYASISSELDGFKITLINNVIFTIKKDSLFISKLRPYKDWSDLYEKFTSHVKVFRSIYGKIKVNSMSTRFINRISAPNPLTDIHERLNLFAVFLSDRFRTFEGSAVSFKGYDQKTDCSYSIRLTLESPLDETSHDTSFFIIDIDAKKDISPSINIDSLELKSYGKMLRNLKNALFFSCLTEKTIRNYSGDAEEE